MTTEAKKAKILAAIASRGYSPIGLYLNEATELAKAGLIKRADHFFPAGNYGIVWVAA